MKDAAVVLPGGERVAASYAEVHEDGVARLDLAFAVGPGRASIEIDYDAPFDAQGSGLFRTTDGGDHYAFTQMEAIYARQCFPGFDEPRFKTPFDVTLTVRKEHAAIANGRQISGEEVGAMKRLRFARTEPLPTYLIAFAVGPLDVVAAPDIPESAVRDRPIPLRGVAARGKGAKLAWSLARVPKLLGWLETYFGTPYPFDKLDMIAIPDFGSGAMENAGAITFTEHYFLVSGDDAPAEQRRAALYTISHELAHQWFGNLVTMPWWDDLWLNEAFASWIEGKAVKALVPEIPLDLDNLEYTHGAMAEDSLIAARRIRQTIESRHDIEAAFDSITYSKGAAVLEMFERWLGAEVFQRGVRRYLEAHRMGTATATELFTALSAEAGRDVAPALKTFIAQPGLPMVKMAVDCSAGRGRVTLAQDRYLPLGLHGPGGALLWKIPVCVRANDVNSACTLIEDRTGVIDLGGECPQWVVPNAGAAGYYRFELDRAWLAKLRGDGELTPAERLAVADSVRASFLAGRMELADALEALAPLASSEASALASAPMPVLAMMRSFALDAAGRAGLEAYTAKLYAPAFAALGFGRRGDGDDVRLRRHAVLDHLAFVARDRSVRQKLGRLAERGGADNDVAPIALAVRVEDGGKAAFEAVLAALEKSEDSEERDRLIDALGHATDAELAGRARDLALAPAVRSSEVLSLLRTHASVELNRGALFDWMAEHLDALLAKIPVERVGEVPELFLVFCSEQDASRLDKLLRGRVERMYGAPRALDKTLETIRSCAAVSAHHSAAAQRFFAPR